MNEIQKNTILVIEDSTTQALHIKTLLEQEGLNVFVAQNGRVGLQMARSELPALIVLDLQMPEMNGLQVCQGLKESPDTKDIPVIMFTAHDEQEMVMLVLQLGAIDFIPKDVFADAVLLETLRQMGLIGSQVYQGTV